MKEEILACIAEEMRALGLPYAYGRWEEPDLPEAWFVGSMTQRETSREDGGGAYVFTLRGTSDDPAALKAAEKKILAAFPTVSGLRLKGADYAAMILGGESQLLTSRWEVFQQLEIRLYIYEWSVNA